jgi:outer membrane protein assembly factor BamB
VNACTVGVAPGSDEAETNAVSGGEGAADTGSEGSLNCDGTGFRDESLEVRDGKYNRPEDPKPDRRSDFAHTEGIVCNSAPPETPESEAGALGGKGRVRALEENSRKELWKKSVRSQSVYDSGSVIGDEPTRITNRPDDGEYEDWTPEFKPGGDLVAWDARSGKEQWRLKTPEDELCSPEKIGQWVFVTCKRDDGSRLTLYRLDREKRKLVRLYAQKDKGQETGPIGMDGDSLVYLPSENEFPPAKEFKDLVRVDSRTGEKQQKKLPGSIPQGAKPFLIRGDLYFQQQKGKSTELVVVDAVTGEERWKATMPMRYPSGPTVSAKRDEVYFAGPAGRLIAFNRENGEERWRTKKARAEDGGTKPGELGAISSVALVRDVLVASAGNTVFSVSPDDPDAEPKVKHKVNLKQSESS